MSRRWQVPRPARGQGGFTLVEVVISAAIGVVLMTALTSVVLTTWRATSIASSRVEASAQIRNFQYFAYGDFAGSRPPPGGCSAASPCTTEPLVLSGTSASNTVPPVASPYQVTYRWDGSSFLDRTVASTGATTHAATDVTAFSWYVDSSSGAPTVVITLTVTIGSYSDTQAFRFMPRVNP